MNRAVIDKLLHTEPGESNYIYVHDDYGMCCAICMAGKMALFLGTNSKDASYFSLDSFLAYIREIYLTGSYIGEYTFVLACRRKATNDSCKAALDDIGVGAKDGWKLLRNKDYLSQELFRPELEAALARFERRQKGPGEEDRLKDRFCRMDKNGNCVGIIDKLLVDHLLETEHMFVCLGSLYLYHDGVYSEDPDGIMIKNIMQKYLHTSMIKARTLNNLYHLLMMQEEIQVPADKINQYPVTWINFKNGMLDVETMEMRPHSPDYLSINQIPHNYVRCYDASRWEQTHRFLQTSAASAEDIGMLLTYAGLCMTRDTRQQVFMMLKGEGGTGKSRVIHLIEYMVGRDNTSNVSLQDLNNRFYPSNLFHKLLNSCADIPSSAMENIDVLKKATGEDILIYERKGQDPREFFSYAKLLFSANKIPLNLDEKSNAFYRRLLIYEMNRVPEKEDRALDQKLEAEVEMTINRAVDALHRMYTSPSSKIEKSDNSRRLVLQQKMDADSVEAFLQECTLRIKGKRTKRAAMYNAYIDYCDENERMRHKKRQFFASMVEKGIFLTTLNGYVYFDGIVLVEEAAKDDFMPIDGQQIEIPFD